MLSSGGGDRAVVALRMIRTDWEMETDDGAVAVAIGNHYNPWIRDDPRDGPVWERSTLAETTSRLPHPTDLFVRMLGETPTDPGALRWTIGVVAVARAHPQFRHLESVLGQPASRYLLPCIDSRLEFLLSIDQDLPSVRQALTETRALSRRPAPASAPRRGPVGRQVAHRVRQVGVLVRNVRRYGGIRGTVSYLRSSRG